MSRPHAFFVTQAGPFKRIHLCDCRYARFPYVWADQFNGDRVELLTSLMETGAFNWHIGCRVCCPGLDFSLREAHAGHIRPHVDDFLHLADSG